jgi:hypothetical protein
MVGASVAKLRRSAIRKTLNIEHRQLRAAAGRSSAGAGRISRPSRRLRALALAAWLASLCAASPAFSAGASGDRGIPSPAGKALANSLTYDNFAGACAIDAFSTIAKGHLSIAGAVVADGSTQLNGVLFDLYTLSLGSGPATFDTTFDRVFTPPPPSSLTYTFVFTTSVRQGGRELGRSITTISCAAGIFSATNVWESFPEPVPAGDPASWALLASLLAAAAGLRIARRRA